MKINNDDDLFDALRAVSKYMMAEARRIGMEDISKLKYKTTSPTKNRGLVVANAKIEQLETRKTLIIDIKLTEDI